MEALVEREAPVLADGVPELAMLYTEQQHTQTRSRLKLPADEL